MSVVKVELNSSGVRDLLRHPEVEKHLMGHAEEIAARAGPGMEPSSIRGKNRARASVITADSGARRAEAVDRALTIAIGAGRDLVKYTTASGNTRWATQKEVAYWTRNRR